MPMLEMCLQKPTLKNVFTEFLGRLQLGMQTAINTLQGEKKLQRKKVLCRIPIAGNVFTFQICFDKLI